MQCFNMFNKHCIASGAWRVAHRSNYCVLSKVVQLLWGYWPKWVLQVTLIHKHHDLHAGHLPNDSNFDWCLRRLSYTGFTCNYEHFHSYQQYFFEILQIAGIPSVSNPQHFLQDFTFKGKKTLIWKYALVGVFHCGNWAWRTGNRILLSLEDQLGMTPRGVTSPLPV